VPPAKDMVPLIVRSESNVTVTPAGITTELPVNKSKPGLFPPQVDAFDQLPLNDALNDEAVETLQIPNNKNIVSRAAFAESKLFVFILSGFKYCYLIF
jgi:hypothetical protein